MAGERYLWEMAPIPGEGGHVFGKTSSDLIAFYGGTPAAQPTAPTAVATTVSVSSVSTSTWAYSTSTQANAIVTAVNTLIGIVTTLGLAA